jgi:hypothetical protein
MNIKDSQDGKIITLSGPFDNRGKILNAFYFIAFSGGGAAFAYKLGREGLLTIGSFLFLCAVGGIYIFAGCRFLNKALQSEKLLVTRTELAIQRTGFLSKLKTIYNPARITNFRYVTKPETTRHPLAGDTFDYLGFQTQQQVINEMHGDNKLAFDYEGRAIQFGENMYSWDFEELGKLLYKQTDNAAFTINIGPQEFGEVAGDVDADTPV